MLAFSLDTGLNTGVSGYRIAFNFPRRYEQKLGSACEVAKAIDWQEPKPNPESYCDNAYPEKERACQGELAAKLNAL